MAPARRGHIHCGRRSSADPPRLIHGLEQLCTRRTPRLPSRQGHAQVEIRFDVAGIWDSAGWLDNHVWCLSILEAVCVVFRILASGAGAQALARGIAVAHGVRTYAQTCL